MANTKKTWGRGVLLKRCACPEKKQSGCTHPWHFTMRRGGEPRLWISLSKYLRARHDVRPTSNRGEAEIIAAEIEAAVKAGTFERRPVATAPTADAPPTGDGSTLFATAAAAVVEERAERVTAKQERSRYKVIGALTIDGSAPVAEWPLAAFTSALVVKIYRAITGAADGSGVQHSNSSKRKYRRALKRVFVLAVREGWIAAAASPFAGDKGETMKAGACAMRNERVRPELAARLIAGATGATRSAAGERLAALILAAIECGARKGELLAIKWRDVQYERGCIVITATERGAKKTGKSRIVPLSAALAEALAPLRIGLDGRELGGNSYVFHDGTGGRIKGVQRAWEGAIARAYGITLAFVTGTKRYTLATRAALRGINEGAGLHFHDLRHEAALRWHEAGVELNAIATLLGHADLDQLRTYLGIKQDDALASFARAMGAPPARTADGALVFAPRRTKGAAGA